MPFFIRHFGKERAKEKFLYYLEGTNIGDRTFEEMISMVSHDLNLSKEEIMKDWIMNLTINWELLDCILKLRQDNYVCILSNAASGLVEKMMLYNGVELEKYFDRVFISANYHMEKPNFDFYQMAVSQFDKNEINKVYMIDDQMVNLENLPKIDINPILMTNNQEVINKLLKTNVKN